MRRPRERLLDWAQMALARADCTRRAEWFAYRRRASAQLPFLSSDRRASRMLARELPFGPMSAYPRGRHWHMDVILRAAVGTAQTPATPYHHGLTRNPCDPTTSASLSLRPCRSNGSGPRRCERAPELACARPAWTSSASTCCCSRSGRSAVATGYEALERRLMLVHRRLATLVVPCLEARACRRTPQRSSIVPWDETDDPIARRPRSWRRPATPPSAITWARFLLDLQRACRTPSSPKAKRHPRLG